MTLRFCFHGDEVYMHTRDLVAFLRDNDQPELAVAVLQLRQGFIDLAEEEEEEWS